MAGPALNPILNAGTGTNLAAPSVGSSSSASSPSSSSTTQYNPGKKGRGTENQAGANATQQYNTDTGVENTVIPEVEQWASENMPSSSGALSPYASAQYGQDVENIANTYQGLRQAGFKMLGASGFGSGPSGRESSMLNTLLNQQGQQDTGAYQTALQSTENEGNTAAGELEGLASIFNPLNANSQLAGIGVNQNKMGSTLTDVASGLGVAASLLGAPATGGLSLLGLGPSLSAATSSGSSAVPSEYSGGTTGLGEYAPSSSTSGTITDSPITAPTTFSASSTAPTSASTGGQGVPAGLSALFAPQSSPAPNLTPAASTRKNTGGFNSLAA